MGEPLDLVLPPAWKRSFARRIGRTGWIITAAWSWQNWTVGAEVINAKLGKGLALVMGPLWLGAAGCVFPPIPSSGGRND